MAKLKTYSISTNITSALVDSGRLHGEIQSSGYVSGFKGISIDGDNVEIIGDSLLNESALDTLLQNHDGTEEVITEMKGDGYYYAEGELESSTTSGTYANKVAFDTPELDNGNYEIAWCAETQNTSGNGRTELLILVDGTEIGQSGIEAEDSKDWQPHSGFKVMNLSGVTSIQFQWRRQSGGTSKIRRARIKITQI